MSRVSDERSVDGVPIVRLKSDHLQVDVAPSVGGRIVSVIAKASGHEFLWRNTATRLQRLPTGSDFDPTFYGGIDELLPNDIPENINGVGSPDHGELWTTALDHRIEGSQLSLQGKLPICRLVYERHMTLRTDSPHIDFVYRITNPTGQTKLFMWKLHAAIAIEPGDVIDCPARRAQVPDLEWSRYKTLEPFDWPIIEGRNASVVPANDGTVDFFYLFDLKAGKMAWRRTSNGLVFTYQFDTKVFPYAWLFASYGGFEGHYTAVLEPCTTMPISVNQAAAKGQCSTLAPGQVLETQVSIYAGPATNEDGRQ